MFHFWTGEKRFNPWSSYSRKKADRFCTFGGSIQSTFPFICLLIINEYSKSCLHYLEFVQNEPVDVISDADESMSGNSPSSPTSGTAEDGGISQDYDTY